MRPYPIFIVILLAALVLGCAGSPDGPDDQAITEGPSGRTYTNEALGFQVTIPTPIDTLWGMSVQTLHHTGFLSDGTTLSILITGPRGRGGFEPTLSLLPFPVSRGASLQDLAAQAAKDFAASYTNYREGTHLATTVAGVPAERWTFTARNVGQGDRFLVVLLISGKLGYLFEGNGIEGDYPTDAYDRILKTFRLL